MRDQTEVLKAVLEKTYLSIKSELVYELFSDLKDIIEDVSFPLADIILTVYKFEERFGIRYADSNAFNILDVILNIIEDNEENANRIFEFVTNNCEWFLAINKLLMCNNQYLSDTQIRKILPVANEFGFEWDSEYREWSWKPQ